MEGGNFTILRVAELNCCGLTSCKKRFDRMGGGRGVGGIVLFENIVTESEGRAGPGAPHRILLG